MPNYRPPRELTGTPAEASLGRGTHLYRVHARHRPSEGFNPRPAHCLYGGGRFDGTGCDAYSFLYAGLSPAAAVCETLLRSIPFDPEGGPRLVPRAAVEGRRISRLRLAAEVTLLSLLSGRDLAAVHQDSWLVQAEARDYAYTRDWAHWIRRHSGPSAQGLVWSSKREPGDRTVVLFGDRCPPKAVRPANDSGTDAGGMDFGTPEGEKWLNSVLEPYHARVAP